MGACTCKHNPVKIKHTPRQSSFDLDLILTELDKQRANTDAIIAELKHLNASAIALRDYDLFEFNIHLGNVLCTTCFTQRQQIELTRLVIEHVNVRLCMEDLFLSCLEFSPPQVEFVILYI